MVMGTRKWDVGSAGGPSLVGANEYGNLKREVKTVATNRFMVTRSLDEMAWW